MSINRKVTDLRSALKLLELVPGQIIKTDELVAPHAELCGVYRHIGAGGTVMRPTRIGPVMMFNHVKGYKNARVVIGLLASRERVGLLLDTKPTRLGFRLNEAVKSPIAPIVVGQDKALCQEVVHYADKPGFDIRKIIPAPTNTEEDAGPYITLGMCYASDPNNETSDITIHRLCLQSKVYVFSSRGAALGGFSKKSRRCG